MEPKTATILLWGILLTTKTGAIVAPFDYRHSSSLQHPGNNHQGHDQQGHDHQGHGQQGHSVHKVDLEGATHVTGQSPDVHHRPAPLDTVPRPHNGQHGQHKQHGQNGQHKQHGHHSGRPTHGLTHHSGGQSGSFTHGSQGGVRGHHRGPHHHAKGQQLDTKTEQFPVKGGARASFDQSGVAVYDRNIPISYGSQPEPAYAPYPSAIYEQTQPGTYGFLSLPYHQTVPTYYEHGAPIAYGQTELFAYGSASPTHDQIVPSVYEHNLQNTYMQNPPPFYEPIPLPDYGQHGPANYGQNEPVFPGPPSYIQATNVPHEQNTPGVVYLPNEANVPGHMSMDLPSAYGPNPPVHYSQKVANVPDQYLMNPPNIYEPNLPVPYGQSEANVLGQYSMNPNIYEPNPPVQYGQNAPPVPGLNTAYIHETNVPSTYEQYTPSTNEVMNGPNVHELNMNDKSRLDEHELYSPTMNASADDVKNVTNGEQDAPANARTVSTSDAQEALAIFSKSIIKATENNSTSALNATEPESPKARAVLGSHIGGVYGVINGKAYGASTGGLHGVGPLGVYGANTGKIHGAGRGGIYNGNLGGIHGVGPLGVYGGNYGKLGGIGPLGAYGGDVGRLQGIGLLGPYGAFHGKQLSGVPTLPLVPPLPLLIPPIRRLFRSIDETNEENAIEKRELDNLNIFSRWPSKLYGNQIDSSIPLNLHDNKFGGSYFGSKNGLVDLRMTRLQTNIYPPLVYLPPVKRIYRNVEENEKFENSQGIRKRYLSNDGQLLQHFGNNQIPEPQHVSPVGSAPTKPDGLNAEPGLSAPYGNYRGNSHGTSYRSQSYYFPDQHNSEHSMNMPNVIFNYDNFIPPFYEDNYGAMPSVENEYDSTEYLADGARSLNEWRSIVHSNNRDSNYKPAHEIHHAYARKSALTPQVTNYDATYPAVTLQSPGHYWSSVNTLPSSVNHGPQNGNSPSNHGIQPSGPQYGPSVELKPAVTNYGPAYGSSPSNYGIQPSGPQYGSSVGVKPEVTYYGPLYEKDPSNYAPQPSLPHGSSIQFKPAVNNYGPQYGNSPSSYGIQPSGPQYGPSVELKPALTNYGSQYANGPSNYGPQSSGPQYGSSVELKPAVPYHATKYNSGPVSYNHEPTLQVTFRPTVVNYDNQYENHPVNYVTNQMVNGEPPKQVNQLTQQYEAPAESQTMQPNYGNHPGNIQHVGGEMLSDVVKNEAYNQNEPSYEPVGNQHYTIMLLNVPYVDHSNPIPLNQILPLVLHADQHAVYGQQSAKYGPQLVTKVTYKQHEYPYSHRETYGRYSKIEPITEGKFSEEHEFRSRAAKGYLKPQPESQIDVRLQNEDQYGPKNYGQQNGVPYQNYGGIGPNNYVTEQNYQQQHNINSQNENTFTNTRPNRPIVNSLQTVNPKPISLSPTLNEVIQSIKTSPLNTLQTNQQVEQSRQLPLNTNSPTTSPHLALIDKITSQQLTLVRDLLQKTTPKPSNVLPLLLGVMGMGVDGRLDAHKNQGTGNKKTISGYKLHEYDHKGTDYGFGQPPWGKPDGYQGPQQSTYPSNGGYSSNVNMNVLSTQTPLGVNVPKMNQNLYSSVTTYPQSNPNNAYDNFGNVLQNGGGIYNMGGIKPVGLPYHQVHEDTGYDMRQTGLNGGVYGNTNNVVGLGGNIGRRKLGYQR